MEYQNIINLLDNTTNQSSKCRIKTWVEINDKSQGKYDSSSIKFKISMIRSDLSNNLIISMDINTCYWNYSNYWSSKWW